MNGRVEYNAPSFTSQKTVFFLWFLLNDMGITRLNYVFAVEVTQYTGLGSVLLSYIFNTEIRVILF